MIPRESGERERKLSVGKRAVRALRVKTSKGFTQQRTKKRKKAEKDQKGRRERA
jgi:hypothetical protein